MAFRQVLCNKKSKWGASVRLLPRLCDTDPRAVVVVPVNKHKDLDLSAYTTHEIRSANLCPLHANAWTLLNPRGTLDKRLYPIIPATEPNLRQCLDTDLVMWVDTRYAVSGKSGKLTGVGAWIYLIPGRDMKWIVATFGGGPTMRSPTSATPERGLGSSAHIPGIGPAAYPQPPESSDREEEEEDDDDNEDEEDEDEDMDHVVSEESASDAHWALAATTTGGKRPRVVDYPPSVPEKKARVVGFARAETVHELTNPDVFDTLLHDAGSYYTPAYVDMNNVMIDRAINAVSLVEQLSALVLEDEPEVAMDMVADDGPITFFPDPGAATPRYPDPDAVY